MEPTLQILSDFSHLQASLNRELETGGPFCNRLFYGGIWPMIQGFDAPKGKKPGEVLGSAGPFGPPALRPSARADSTARGGLRAPSGRGVVAELGVAAAGAA